MQEEKFIPENTINTVLEEDFHFKGKLKFKTSLKIKGKLEGEIDAPTGHLVIGSTSAINASINANILTNFGDIKGDVNTNERLELFNQSSLDGNLNTAELFIERGGVFNGKVTMKKKF